IQQQYQRLDVLINNAGFGIAGPLEETPMEEAKRVFDVNVFGMLQVSQHALPLLKKTKGMIINIGSVASDFSLPFQTIYSMSKASVASFTEGLRNELRPFGIRVVNVKPGDTKSNFSTQRKVFVSPSSPYEKRVHRSVAVMEKDEKNGLPTASVYKVCRRLVNQKHPPVHVTIGLQYQVLQTLGWLLPTKLVQWLLYQIYGK
ncbi:MAG: SDR family NAD(P)-dependent oxidoreductase, partial [Bacilli bacterium]